MEKYKKNLYILTYFHVMEELREIYKETSILFDRNSGENLLKVRKRIKNLISHIENVPSFGEPEKIGERKKKLSIYYEYKIYILNELSGINENINDALETSKGKVLKYADTLSKIQEFGKSIPKFRTYCYNTERENFECEKFLKRYRQFKDSFKN